MGEESLSILNTIKKLIGLDKDYGAFDLDLVVAINSSFTILRQLGVGPTYEYSISGPEETWSDFFADSKQISLAKSYIYLRAKLLFDPSASSSLLDAIKQQISEFEWRLTVQAETETDTENPDPGPIEGTSDHSKLFNRDLPDQHPIGAITGLETELDTIPRAMTQEELLDILNGEGGGTVGLAGDLFEWRRSKNSLGENQS